MTQTRMEKIDELLSEVGLGRLPAADPRDKNFPMRELVRPSVAKQYTTRYWPYFHGALDQGNTPRCVGFAWTAFILATPVVHKTTPEVEAGSFATIGTPWQFAQKLYNRAQQIDEWPGENYGGTSVRAGAKVLTEQGRLSEYRWAWNADAARDYVLTRGPVILGTDWFMDMFLPDSNGWLKPTGSLAGGHAYVAIGFSRTRDAFRILNSWGKDWGQNGRAWLKRSDAAKLIDMNGEACSGLEVKTT